MSIWFSQNLAEWMVWAVCAFSVLNGTIYYTYLWQLKEYRLDRVLEALNQKSFRERIFAPFLMGKWLFFLIGLSAWVVKIISFESWVLLLAIAFGFEFIEFCSRVFNRKFYRPDLTMKAVLICGMEVLLFGILLVYLHFSAAAPLDQLFWLFVATLFVADLNSILVMVINPFANLMKKKIIRAATIKIANRKDLKVIGITGSFGKSSTKEFLAKILSKKFKVLKTPGNTNVDIGVAKIILNQLDPEHQIMIVEMGAYKNGEINNITDIAHPDIGIITAVHKAHLGLFGSLEKIAEAKFELIVGLKEGGLGIFNLDDKGAAQLYEKAKIYPIKRSTVSFETAADCRAENFSVNTEGLNFEISGHKFSTKLFGSQNLPNLLLAIATAQSCGMSLKEIAGAVSEIEPIARTMKLNRLSTKIWLVDDSYNTSPVAAKAAIDSLDLISGAKKILFFPGMLELGKDSDQEHEILGKEISKKIDYAFFTSTDFQKPLEKGLSSENSKCQYFFNLTQSEILEKLRKIINAEQKVVILMESRGADYVEHFLRKNHEL